MRMGIGLGVGINRSNYAQGIFNAYSARVVADGGVVEGGACVDAVSSLLQSASLLLIPSGYKGGKLYAEIPTNGNGDLTWTRGSDAFRTNASGLIQRVPWNLLQQSETFENAYWTKSGSSVTANSTTAPNGTLTADKLVENTANTDHRINSTFSATIGTSYTTSIYLKSAERTSVKLYSNIQGGVKSVIVNLSNGTFSSSTLPNAPTISNVGDGWYRVSYVQTADISSPISVYVVLLNASNQESYTGDGTSGLYIWGAQLVEGSSAQTYFPTTDRLNFPRLSYMYGSCPALLLEPQRTNLALQSEDFSSASWIKSLSSVTANTATSPDGNTTADSFIGDGTSAAHNMSQSINVTSGVTYSISVYSKKNTNNFVQILGSAGAFGVSFYANFDLNNGAVGTVGSSATASITSVGNGWYRCTITGAATATVASFPGVTLITSSTSVRNEINTLSTSVYLWGFQMELGAYPTTYIPTTSATATRIADSFSRNNIYTNGLITSSGGTWYVELRNNISYATSNFSAIGVGDTTALTTNSLILFQFNSTGERVKIAKYVGGTPTIVFSTTTDNVKIAIKWNGTSADVFVNGTKQVSATSFAPTNMENLIAPNIGLPFFIQQMALFPTPLTDTQCQTLTT